MRVGNLLSRVDEAYCHVHKAENLIGIILSGIAYSRCELQLYDPCTVKFEKFDAVRVGILVIRADEGFCHVHEAENLIGIFLMGIAYSRR